MLTLNGSWISISCVVIILSSRGSSPSRSSICPSVHRTSLYCTSPTASWQAFLHASRDKSWLPEVPPSGRRSKVLVQRISLISGERTDLVPVILIADNCSYLSCEVIMIYREALPWLNLSITQRKPAQPALGCSHTLPLFESDSIQLHQP